MTIRAVSDALTLRRLDLLAGTAGLHISTIRAAYAADIAMSRCLGVKGRSRDLIIRPGTVMASGLHT